MNLILIAILGLLVGSFINATAMRSSTSRVNTKRSKCFTCGSILGVKNLIPLVSWLSQKGRCDMCFSKISGRYLIIELITALLFVLMFYISANTLLLGVNLIIAALLMFIVVTDLDRFVVLHQASIPLVLIGFLTMIFDYQTFTVGIPSLWHLLAGPILAIFFWLIWLISNGRAMGFADGTIALFIGWVLGLKLGISALFISFWLGAIVSCGLILWQKRMGNETGSNALNLKSPVPFGPFLILGFLIVYITGIAVI